MSIEIDINDRTPPTPCQTEGCGRPRFHVCTFGKPDLFPQLLGLLYAGKLDRRFGGRTAAHKEALRRSANARWAQHYAKNKERDDSIVERYAQGDIGMKPLANEFGLSYGATRLILQRAAAQGRIAINAKGVMPTNTDRQIA